MGQKIKKESILYEIQEKIKTCELYQKHSPDESAKKRVEVLDKNPCGDGKYYTVITLKQPVSEKSSKMEDLLKHKITGNIILKGEDYDKIFSKGCIIWYNLKQNQIQVKSYTSLPEIFNTLIHNAFNKNSKILRFNPSKGGLFGSLTKYPSLKEDYDTYIDIYDEIIYSFGRFKPAPDFIKEKIKYNEEKNWLYSYMFPFDKVSYINETRLTSFEKNVNAEIDEKILNDVTNLNAKKEIPNEKLLEECSRYI